MLITRRDRISTGPVAAPGAARPSGTKRAKGTESSFDHLTLSAGQEASPAFRDLAASLSQQVRTFNTTGKIQELRSQVASGTYRPDARETAAQMLLLTEEQ